MSTGQTMPVPPAANHDTYRRRLQRIEAMGDIAVVLAHKIRNPLGSIQIYAALLEKDWAGHSEQTNLAQKIVQEVQRIDLTLSNLLVFSTAPKPRCETASLQQLCEDVLWSARLMLESAGVTLRRNFQDEAEACHCDPEWMKQLLINVVLNAVQAMPGGGTLTLETRREGTAVKLRVTDNGTGISQDILPRVTDPFFTTRPRSTGLGLTTACRVAAAHGGTVAIVSPEGQGTVFELTLPDLKQEREGIQS